MKSIAAWRVSALLVCAGLAVSACETTGDVQNGGALPTGGASPAGSSSGGASAAGPSSADSGGQRTSVGGSAGAGGNAGAAGAGRSGSAGGGTTGGAGVAGAVGTTGGAASGGNSALGGAGGFGGVAVAGGGADAGGAGDSAGRGGTSGSVGSGGTSGAASAGTAGLGTAPPIGKKFVGNIDTRAQIRSDFIEYWNQFTPENAGKWGSIERTRDQMNWTNLDRMYDYAKQTGVLFKQHTLLWGSQQPSWLTGLSQAEQREEVEEWIRLYCERYPETQLIDVVNEPPPHTTPPYVAALGGAGSSGYDWIAQAFKWAHQYCPNAVLILNDYNNIEYPADNDHTIDIAKKIMSAGAPIDAIGAQAHDAYKLSTSTVEMYIDRIISQTGLPVYISEYDIDLADDNQQKNVMQSQFTMFWNKDKIVGITLWGYVSGMTWKPNTGLMSSSGTPRPAMTWLQDFLGTQ
jgi:endo-1,4-beta-xylanase